MSGAVCRSGLRRQLTTDSDLSWESCQNALRVRLPATAVKRLAPQLQAVAAAAESSGGAPAEAPADSNAAAALSEAGPGADAAPGFNFVKACMSRDKRSCEKAGKKAGKAKAEAAGGAGLEGKAVGKKAVKADSVKQQGVQKDVIHPEMVGAQSSEGRRASAAAEALLRVRRISHFCFNHFRAVSNNTTRAFVWIQNESPWSTRSRLWLMWTMQLFSKDCCLAFVSFPRVSLAWDRLAKAVHWCPNMCTQTSG